MDDKSSLNRSGNAGSERRIAGGVQRKGEGRGEIRGEPKQPSGEGRVSKRGGRLQSGPLWGSGAARRRRGSPGLPSGDGGRAGRGPGRAIRGLSTESGRHHPSQQNSYPPASSLHAYFPRYCFFTSRGVIEELTEVSTASNDVAKWFVICFSFKCIVFLQFLHV
jgi:hypothetical protein